MITLKQRLKGFQLKRENKDHLDWYDQLYSFQTGPVLIFMELVFDDLCYIRSDFAYLGTFREVYYAA